MMIANASGNAASSPMPPRISHVSLPSQIGATVFIISVRASSSRASGNRMPTPRSNPSSSTYMKTPTPRMTVQTGTRSSGIAFPSAFRAGERACGALVEIRLAQLDVLGRAGARQADHVEDARAEHDEVDEDVERDRDQHVRPGERWRHGVARAHQDVDDPGLPSHLGDGPSGDYGDKARRQHREAGVVVRARRVQPIAASQ